MISFLTGRPLGNRSWFWKFKKKFSEFRKKGLFSVLSSGDIQGWKKIDGYWELIINFQYDTKSNWF